MPRRTPLSPPTTLYYLLIHEAQQGCRDATYEPSRFPVAVPYPSPHRVTPAYVVVTSSDLDTSRNKASVSGLSWISRLYYLSASCAPSSHTVHGHLVCSAIRPSRQRNSPVRLPRPLPSQPRSEADHCRTIYAWTMYPAERRSAVGAPFHSRSPARRAPRIPFRRRGTEVFSNTLEFQSACFPSESQPLATVTGPRLQLPPTDWQ